MSARSWGDSWKRLVAMSWVLGFWLALCMSAVHVGHDEVNGSQIGDQVRDHGAANHRRNLLQVRERWRADPCPVAHRALVRGQVVAVDALGGLDHEAGLA